MYCSVDARYLRNKELLKFFDPEQSSNYFSKSSMLIKQNELDHELAKKELSRKHVPYEPTSLLRCLAERLYSSQLFWSTKVKCELITYFNNLISIQEDGKVVDETSGQESTQVDLELIRKLMSLLKKIEEGSSDTGPTFDDHIQLIQLVADCYKVKLFVFREDRPRADALEFAPRDEGVEGFTSHKEEVVQLSITASGHVDIVLTFQQVANRAMVQAMLYEVLYQDVFKYPKELIDGTVKEMLYEKKYALARMARKRHAQRQAREGKPTDEIPDEIAILPPISYKDAKALDMGLYRNVTMDIWLQQNKERFTAMKVAELQPGDRCIVTKNKRRKALGTFKAKVGADRFEVELSNGHIVFVRVEELELLSKRKERHANYAPMPFNHLTIQTETLPSPTSSIGSEPISYGSSVSSPTFSSSSSIGGQWPQPYWYNYCGHGFNPYPAFNPSSWYASAASVQQPLTTTPNFQPPVFYQPMSSNYFFPPYFILPQTNFH